MVVNNISTSIFILVKNPPMLCFLIAGVLALLERPNYATFLGAGVVLQVLWLLIFKKPIL